MIDPDLGGERSRQQPLLLRQIDGHTCRIAPGAVDRFDGAGRQLQYFSCLCQRLSLGARVLDLVVEAEHLGLGTRGRQLLLELAGYRFQRPDLLGLDLENVHQDGTEATFNRRADLTLLEREGSVGYRAVDYASLGYRTE